MFSGLVKRQQLIQKIIKDAISFSKVDWTTFKDLYFYTLTYTKDSQWIDDCTKKQKFVIKFTRPQALKPPQKLNFNNYYSTHRYVKKLTESDSSTDDDIPDPTLENRYGFKPSQNFQTSFTSGICDLEKNDDLFKTELFELIRSTSRAKSKLRSKDLKLLTNFFSKFTISDETRREVWRARIGNKLGITRGIFNGLLARLNRQRIPKKVESQIVKDLNRLFPDCRTFQEGREMYNKMQTILRMFQAYRPDIGFVQGMTYLLITIYHLFDEFETFVLFSNLVVTNRFVNSLYTFDVERVSEFEHFLSFFFDFENFDFFNFWPFELP